MSEYLYNFKNITAIVGGIPITGVAPGDDGIQITYSSPNFNHVVGAYGDAVASLINDQTATVVFRLLQSSPSNDFFSTLSAAYRIGTVVINPFVLRDAYGRDLHVAPHLYVTARPNATYGQNQNNREWSCLCLQLTSFVGGSGPLA